MTDVWAKKGRFTLITQKIKLQLAETTMFWIYNLEGINLIIVFQNGIRINILAFDIRTGYFFTSYLEWLIFLIIIICALLFKGVTDWIQFSVSPAMTSYNGTENLLPRRGGLGFAWSSSLGSHFCRRIHTFRICCENLCVNCG